MQHKYFYVRVCLVTIGMACVMELYFKRDKEQVYILFFNQFHVREKKTKGSKSSQKIDYYSYTIIYFCDGLKMIESNKD